MAETFWNMEIGDMLEETIKAEVDSPRQRRYLLEAYRRMEEYVVDHDDDSSLTFREFLDVYGRP